MEQLMSLNRRFRWPRASTAPFLALLVQLLIGCRSGDRSSASVPSNASGRVTGTVHWNGPIPSRRVLDLSGCPDCARTRTTPLLSENVVVNPNRTIESAFALLDFDATVAPPSASVRLESVQCRYQPHVLGVQVGQPLEICNADSSLENVHLLTEASDEINFALPKGRTKMLRFEQPEPDFIHVKSDVHPWMSGWLAVLPHPYFAVTGDDGVYTIENVPPGTYTLVLRHPTLGQKRATVTLIAGSTTTQDFTLEP